MKSTQSLVIFIISLFLINCNSSKIDKSPFIIPQGNIVSSFSVTGDMRDYTGTNRYYFRGVCERLFYGGPGDFMVSPGDIDPPDQVYDTIQNYIGIGFSWYPVVGNHESETESDMTWLRNFNAGGNSLPRVVRIGPLNGVETSYSFDSDNLHIVVLNEYYDGISDVALDGDVGDDLYNWLITDLSSNTKPVTLVFGHESAYSMADEESGRIRHLGDSLDKYGANRDRFWAVLNAYNVKAYISGHTHNYSKTLIDNVWQIDAGHAKGIGDVKSRSTFLMFYLMDDDSIWCYTYRLNLKTYQYELTDFELL